MGLQIQGPEHERASRECGAGLGGSRLNQPLLVGGPSLPCSIRGIRDIRGFSSGFYLIRGCEHLSGGLANTGGQLGGSHHFDVAAPAQNPALDLFEAG